MENKSPLYDYIIVGQGLAGSCLAYQLLKKKQRVLVIDAEKEKTSSKIAAGLFNPITGRKMVKTWQADLLFPYLLSFYSELEQVLNTTFLHQRPIYRPFNDTETYNEWMGQSADEDHNNYISDVFPESQFDYVDDQHGGIRLNSCGYLDIKLFLQVFKNYLVDREAYQRLKFDPSQLRIENDHVSYQQLNAKKIIFCLGTYENSTFFDWLPFKLVKGDILSVRFKQPIDEEVVYNKGVFAFKHLNEDFWVGSTYHHEVLDWESSSKAKKEIEDKLQKMLKIGFEIMGQRSGIRPATVDRKPFIGMHPNDDKIGIFNGLGAKGVSLAPYFSEHFCDYLLNKEKLNENADIQRFHKLYKSKTAN